MSGNNWAARTKQAAAAIPITKSKAGWGEPRKAVVESFIPKVFGTGSFGVEIKYTAEGFQYPVRENIVLKKMNDAGVFEDTKYGASSIKRRLQAFGLSSEEINALPLPVSPKDAEKEEYNFTGAPVTLYIVDREYLGKVYPNVKAVTGPQ